MSLVVAPARSPDWALQSEALGVSGSNCSESLMSSRMPEVEYRVTRLAMRGHLARITSRLMRVDEGLRMFVAVVALIALAWPMDRLQTVAASRYEGRVRGVRVVREHRASEDDRRVGD